MFTRIWGKIAPPTIWLCKRTGLCPEKNLTERGFLQPQWWILLSKGLHKTILQFAKQISQKVGLTDHSSTIYLHNLLPIFHCLLGKVQGKYNDRNGWILQQTWRLSGKCRFWSCRYPERTPIGWGPSGEHTHITSPNYLIYFLRQPWTVTLGLLWACWRSLRVTHSANMHKVHSWLWVSPSCSRHSKLGQCIYIRIMAFIVYYKT